mmetsp:Transcript_15294/g.28882  ORF Transcript_15294/g.28882 Transcript_15294/m.28882 type:complete len:90 (+) Transcript_15294:3-272(+)
MMQRRMLSKLKNIPSLKAFMLRNEALALYREIVRETRRIDKSQRDEALEFARSQFRMHNDVTDTHHIRYLLMEGRQQFDTYKGLLNKTM